MAPTTTTLADDLLLALLDPVSGKPRPAPGLDLGLAGGLLLELALAGGIDVAGPKPAKARVVVVDDTRPHDDLLAGALARIAQRPATAERLVPQLAKGLRPRLLERAEQRGDLRRERLALRRDRWPAADDRRQRELAQRLGDVLLTGVTPDVRTAALVGLLAAIDAAPAAVQAPDRATRKAVARRATEVGEGDWAAEGVRRAVKAAQAAVAAATTAAVIAATTAATTTS